MRQVGIVRRMEIFCAHGWSLTTLGLELDLHIRPTRSAAPDRLSVAWSFGQASGCAVTRLSRSRCGQMVLACPDCGRADTVAEIARPLVGGTTCCTSAAAMEPQPEGCGEDGDLELNCDAYLPQWSRSLMAAEKSSVSGCPLPRLVQPQWSPPMMGERTR